MNTRSCMQRFVPLAPVFLSFAALAPPAWAQAADAPHAGKMWLFEEPPLEHLKATYDFEPTPEWLEKVRLSSLRFDGLGTASFVSPQGLILTNHHCVRGRLERMESEGKNLNDHGYAARSFEQELPMTGAVASQVVAIEDVTERVFAGVDLLLPPEEVQRAIDANRQAILAQARRKHTDLMPELQTFYRGARVHLYLFKNYTDLRLVFAPHLAAGFYGGDTDNFSYPHYGLDFAFVRAYEDGEPADTSAHYFAWATESLGGGELVFSSGFPGSTDRHLTVAELETMRDSTMAINAAATVEMWHTLEAYLEEHPEAREQYGDQLFSIANTGKALQGQVGALHDKGRLKREREIEEELKDRAVEDPELEMLAFAWDEIEIACEELTDATLRFWYQSPSYGGGRRFGPLMRAMYVVEAVHPDATDQERMEAGTQAKSYPGTVGPLDEKLFTYHLERARKALGADDEAVAAMLQGREPADAVKHYLDASRVQDSGFVQTLLDGGWEMVSASDDPAVVAACVLYPLRVENRETRALLQEVIEHQGLLVGKAIDASYGPEVCPEASFGLRLSAGYVAGYDQLSTKLPPFTTFYGMYGRCVEFGDEGDFDLPDVWLERVEHVDLRKAVNFVATIDLIGGSSGSAVINRDAELVGLVFDGNLQNVENDFLYTNEQSRGICVHADAITETVTKIYEAPALTAELLGASAYQ